jgi:hypothetical protein
VRQALGVLLYVVLATLIGGCGGSGSSGQEDTTTTLTAADTTAPTVETTTLPKDAAKEIANSMLLRLSDLPTGWRAQPHEESAGCAGIDKLTERYDVLAKADSKDFARGDTTEASSSAGLFRDERTARDALNYLEASIQSKKFRECLDDFLREQADEDVTFGDVQVGQVSFPTLGDRSSAWEVVIPAKTQGFSFTAYAEAVYMTKSSALAVVLFSDVGTPFDEEMRERLARIVEERMGEAVATIP